MSIISVAVVLFCSLVAANAHDCDKDCSNYNVYIKYFKNLPRPQECRFKLIDGSTNNRKGLELSGYAEQSAHITGVGLDTQWCPGSSRIVATESPAPSEGYGYFAGGSKYRCCIEEVLDQCYHKVVIDLNCKGEGNSDDAIQRVEVTYKNRKAGKKVSVVFHAKYNKVDCTNNYDDTYERITYGSGANSQIKYCGDRDISVSIRRYTHPRTKEIILESSRYECLSQYVRMFVEESSDSTKFTMKTALARNSVNAHGTRYNAVLGATHQGRCGAIVDDVMLSY